MNRSSSSPYPILNSSRPQGFLRAGSLHESINLGRLVHGKLPEFLVQPPYKFGHFHIGRQLLGVRLLMLVPGMNYTSCILNDFGGVLEAKKIRQPKNLRPCILQKKIIRDNDPTKLLGGLPSP